MLKITNGVVAASVVVGCILLSGDELFRVEELSVGSGPDLVDDGRFEVDEDGPGHVLAGAGLGEKGGERVISDLKCQFLNGRKPVFRKMLHSGPAIQYGLDIRPISFSSHFDWITSPAG